MTHSETNRVSDLYLERYHLGELAPAEAEALRRRLEGDPALRERLRRIEAHDKGFANSHPADAWVARIERAARSPQPARGSSADSGVAGITRFFSGLRRERQWALGLAAFAALTLTALPLWVSRPDTEAETETLRAKGEARSAAVGLTLYRQGASGPELLKAGDAVKAGDALQIEIEPGDFTFATVLSIDGRGGVTWHWPANAEASPRLALLPHARLPNAFQLDSAPGFERFYLFLSRDSLALDVLKNAGTLLRASQAHDAEWLTRQWKPGLVVSCLPLRKVP